ncbi:uncharacterized protein LAESUDRAFT_732177 [Laetiporus sulphureus 93-53]|uniref:Zn(2)-C6 fungal-type domain-containing protein n=1 Tax=Laetiporus sulphureus 93-53 TaxID=1314785 RepID=A0A165B9S9_9APHY|nr:uncharacterized protein LAESUDRAFT_732177 [Laetiporus sulphureus 93-53]KZT00577.1 hypothetical protein LAESUDRAFT_732177 [Laetiporus sulphureus 93-53]
MPAERTSETRRASRKTSSNNDEEIEVKRARGEISCAECRRLKLKCDKKLPCGSCVRRGCTTICPNGSLSAGQGTRFILADTEQLHRKISEMSERIRQLEDAVAIFQAGVSNERHPLLRDELLTIKFGPEVRRTVDEEHTREKLSQSIDALGTLTIGDHGETKYFGRSGGSETLFLANRATIEDSEDDLESLPPELENLRLTSPLAIVEDNFEVLLDHLESQLPPQLRAWALCEAYVAHFTWWCRPIKRDELIDDILTPIYNAIKDPAKSRAAYHPHLQDTHRCPHLLAVLFFVLAVGALVDLTLPPCSPEAEKYYRLGRTALSMKSILDSPEIETVQAMIMMAAYHSLCTLRYSIESAWTLSSFATKLAQSIGLHRDSKQWKLEDKAVQRRRNLFWEIFLFELVHCIALGRPPSVNLAHADCELPEDDEDCVAENGEKMSGYWNFKMVFSREVFSPVVDSMLSAKAPSYTAILELDRRIRQVQLPAVKLYLRPDDDDYNNPALCMKSYLMSHYRSLTMIHIHRTFFAQALLDNPTNPLSSPYAPSFLAANRCASILLKSFIHHHERCGELCSRFWGMWTHAFSAAIIIGATVARMPQSSLAPSALMELDLAVDVFERGASKSVRAKQGLPILLKLKERATQAYTQYRDRHLNPTNGIQKISEDYQTALAIFGGQTNILPTKSVPRKRQAPSPTSSNTASTPSEKGTSPSPEFHPSLMTYLSQMPASSPFQAADLTQMHVNEVSTMCPQPPVQPPMQPPVAQPGQNVSMTQSELDFLNSLLSDPAYQSLPPFSPDLNTPMQSNVYTMPSFPGDVVMSDQWVSLMQETGILDGVVDFAQPSSYAEDIFSL